MCGNLLRLSSPGEARKNVATLFIDLVGSTALAERLDPEALREVTDRYFATCLSCITEHGGMVEKFIGDAVMAAFGAVVSHEDDALRAVRAAMATLAAIRELNTEITATHQVSLEVRCGICTGEVVVITAPGADFRVVGDAVNTASRLQTAAAAGDILICPDTAAMVRTRVGLEQVPPLRLKGKAEFVRAWRATDLASPQQDVMAPQAPLIGRADELEELRHRFRRVTRRQQVCLVTVLGAPGVGKSRLVQEFLTDLGPDGALVVSGQCSSYGRGITYQPLAGILGSYPGGWRALEEVLSESPGPGR
jgi:class 3 adenylate cyclase